MKLKNISNSSLEKFLFKNVIDSITFSVNYYFDFSFLTNSISNNFRYENINISKISIYFFHTKIN